MLLETNLNIAAVARHSGFSSDRHMLVDFRRELGESPSEYRKQRQILRSLGLGVCSRQMSGEDAD